jgi:hypothetical protein
MANKTITVSVDATQRVSRFEFQTPHLPTGMVYAYSEVVLQEPAEPSKGSEILKSRTPMGVAQQAGEPTVYGVMMGAHIGRGIPDVADESVEVDGTSISFDTVLKAMDAFFEKWRKEDIEKPAIQPMPTPITAPMEPTLDDPTGAKP